MSAHRPRAGSFGFLSGIFCTQFVNSALHLAQPLLLAEITGSYGYAAFFSAFDTSIHMLGTFLGGWPVDRAGARRVLILSTALRGLALAGIPAGLIMGCATPVWIMSWYTLDALVRGFTDASVFTIPLELAQHERGELDWLNSRFEFMFDLGGVVGPLALSGILLWSKGVTAHIGIPLGFLGAAWLYSRIPARAHEEKLPAHSKALGSWQGLRIIRANPKLLMASLSYTSFSIYPLRKLLAAFFAKALLQNSAAAGIVGGAFGIGGIFGSLLYSRFSSRSTRFWILAGAGGLIFLGWGWLPLSVPWMALAAFAFSLTNVTARLSLTRIRQELTPLSSAGGVTAATRFGANLVSVLIKILIGAAFTVSSNPRLAFALVGASLCALAVAQIGLALGFPKASD